MANDNINDSDSGIASSDVTPVNKENSTLTPPATIPTTTPEPEVEEVSTPGAAASAEEDEIAKMLATHLPAAISKENDDSDEVSLLF